jgi:hypothetical protein
MAGEVSSFFFREEKLQQEIEQEKHAYPELNLQIRTLIQERDVMKSIYRDTYNQKKGHQQDEYMQDPVNPPAGIDE